MASSSVGVGNVIRNKILTEMAMGYSRSRVLCAAAHLGVADAIGDQEQPLNHIAALCGANPDSLYRLLRALASFGAVAECSPKHFVLTPLGQPLRKGAPDSEWAAVVFWSDLIADGWSQLTECVRTGDNAMQVMEREGITPRWSKDPDAGAIFGAVMGTAPAEDYMPIARAWDFSKYHTIADLGGGGGALIAAVLFEFPNARGMLVDGQEALGGAASRFEREGLAARCQIVAADLRKEVPAGADVYMLKHVLHGYTDDAAIEILRNCEAVMPEEGRLLVIEFVLPDVIDRADPKLELKLMSDLNMLAVTGGKERSAAEWEGLLRDAGLEFRGITPVAGESVSIIEAARRVTLKR